MQKIVSYVDLCSYALLSYVNSSLDGCYIEITKDRVKRVIRKYITDHLKDDIAFGKTLILINSCDTKSNFRNNLETYDYKYSLVDSSISVDDIYALHKFFEEEWGEHSLNCIQLKHNNLDFLDMTNILIRKLPFAIVKPPSQYMLADGNNEFMHDDFINRTYVFEVENMLVENKLCL